MKKIIFFLILSIVGNSVVKGQSTAEQLADKMSRKMKDSLSLSDSQKSLLYEINVSLSNQKLALRKEVTNTDSLRVRMQLVENSRDSLYRQVLTEQQFMLYKQKKSRLINSK